MRERDKQGKEASSKEVFGNGANRGRKRRWIEVDTEFFSEDGEIEVRYFNPPLPSMIGKRRDKCAKVL